MVLSEPVHRPHADRQATAETVPGLAARKTAARLLGAVIEATTPLDGLTDDLNGHPNYLALEQRDRGLVRAILHAALRHRGAIDALIAARVNRPLPEGATALNNVLHVAIAQLLWLKVPESAAVNLAVEHAKSDPRIRRFASLVNAVLRGIVRKPLWPMPTSVSMPPWFEERLNAIFDAGDAARIARILAAPAPVDFTIKWDAEGWAEKLGGIVLPTGSVRVARLDGPVPQLPGFAEGQWWVQDAAATIPARLFGPVEGLRIADLCAAPGGKTAQLVQAGARVTAVEKSASRLKRLKANLDRLRMSAQLLEADLLELKPAEPFDAVLLDAPCSSTGTARRHPDVMWTKSLDDVAKLADLQYRMLEKAVTLVKRGGIVVFSNCSLDPMEGEELIARFLKAHPKIAVESAAPHLPEGLAFAVTPQGYVRTSPAALDLGTPEMSGMDGFFAVRLKVGT